MEINEKIWQREIEVVDETNSYHDNDFSASSGKLSKTFKELCEASSDFFRILDDTNIAGVYASDNTKNPILEQQSWFGFEQKDGSIFLNVDNNQNNQTIPFRFCTQNGLKDFNLNQSYGKTLVDGHSYSDDYNANNLIRFLLDFPIKKVLNTVYISVKHVFYEQKDNIQYGFFEIPKEFYENNGVCSLQNYLDVINKKQDEEKKDYVIDNWWIRTDYFNSSGEIKPYFYNIFLSTHVDNVQFAREIVSPAAMMDIHYQKETKDQPLDLYYYYYQNFCFMQYKNQVFDFFHNSCSNIFSNQYNIEVVKQNYNWGSFSNKENIILQRIGQSNTNGFRTSVFLGGNYSKNLSNIQEGCGEIIGNNNVFIGRYKNSNQLLENYSDGNKLLSNNNLFVMFKIWSIEEIEMLMDDMICCWSADFLNLEQKKLFFNGEIDNSKIKNKVRIPIIENNYYVMGKHNFGRNAYDCLPNSILELKEGPDPTIKNDINKILPSPNFSNKKNLDIEVQSSYNDLFELEKNISLWGIRERENGKFLVSDIFPYSYYRNNQINPFIGMIRTKISKPNIIKTENGIVVENLTFTFEDVVKKSIGEEDYQLAEVLVDNFRSTDSSAATSITINSQDSPAGIIENKELDYGFYRGEVASWCENDYEAITFKINFSYNFAPGFQDGDTVIIFLKDEKGEKIGGERQLIYHSEQQTYPNVYFNLKAYDKDKNKKIYRLYFYSDISCGLTATKPNNININDDNMTIKLEVIKK